jgi:hypothetical protein
MKYLPVPVLEQIPDMARLFRQTGGDGKLWRSQLRLQEVDGPVATHLSAFTRGAQEA